MNLNEKCLLKYLTNPIGSFVKDDEKNSNVITKKDFHFLSDLNATLKKSSMVK